ncbi:MAG: ATP-binding cassette domain-containing protein [Anaerolineaceae bacterium]|jgi:ABC-2 type transport system ATP-binding protein|nr:ATP-binding cassette domain-containing protein [Anaerolineaceae bacterium]
MNTIEVNHISKSFGPQKVLNQVSFDVKPGEIFGLLGPNGAGKTTCIRIVLDIFKPDSGSIKIFNSSMSEEKKNLIGYLPEERGLYQDINLENCLTYLASLKGLSDAESHKRINDYLVRFNLDEHKKKKVKELSKGMQQKAQLITTLVHDPKLIIIDEPFSALDPVNTQMVKDILREQRALGKTIVMCTHQMHQVEELCDRLVLINQGESMLYGTLNDVRKKYAGHAIHLRTEDQIPNNLPGVKEVKRLENHHLYQVELMPNVSTQDFLKTLVDANINIDQFEIATPTLDEIFIQVVTESGMKYE